VSDVRLRRGDAVFAVHSVRDGGRTTFTIRRTAGGDDPPEVTVALEVRAPRPGEFVVDGPAGPLRGFAVRRGDEVWVQLAGPAFRMAVERGPARRRAGGGHAEIAAPMPGQVLRVLVAAGDRVERGQTLMVVEAMKMQIEIAAPYAGTVASISASPGDKVMPGVPLADVEPEPAPAGAP
jgi:biotin carboxyl carrier protein